ncbi:hypothetical protein VKS41_003837 [Umbelopsis sp. WA50703]|jgi:hypothetical protein
MDTSTCRVLKKQNSRKHAVPTDAQIINCPVKPDTFCAELTNVPDTLLQSLPQFNIHSGLYGAGFDDVAAAATTDDAEVVCNVEVTDGGRARVLEFIGVTVVNTVAIDVGEADPLNAVDKEVDMTACLTKG